jgi:glutamine amidotransferase
VLGICLGMQLLFEHSEEDGGTEGLGLVAGRVHRIPDAPARPVPHMGWSRTRAAPGSALFAGIGEAAWFYYVHSYAAPTTADTVAQAEYGEAFTAAVSRGNVHGVQFHPERSGDAGARLLANFLALPAA